MDQIKHRADAGGGRGLILLMFLAVALYTVLVAWSVHKRGLFEYVGLDYRIYRATAEIALNEGFPKAYDLQLLETGQRKLYDSYSRKSAGITMPFIFSSAVYLPAFFIPFLVIPMFPPVAGFVFWAAANALLLTLYIRRLGKALDYGSGWQTPLLFMISLPVFMDILFGQVSGWMLIMFGEFTLAFLRKRDVSGGLWLGGMIIKPQVLVLLLPAVLIRRRFGVIWGFLISSVSIIMLSTILAGTEGMKDCLGIILSMRRDQPLIFPQSMMNWRALSINVSPATGGTLSWAAAWAGMIITAVFALRLWREDFDHSVAETGYMLLGTYAATAAVTWHSHVHMAVPLIVPLMMLQSDRRMRGVSAFWSLAPALLFPASSFILSPGTAHNLAGTVFLAMNISLLAISYRALIKGRRSGAAP